MKKINILVLIGPAILFSSCFSSMKVRVDALNMPAFKATYLYNSEKMNKLEQDLNYILSPNFKDTVRNGLDRVANYIKTSGEVPIEDTMEFVSEIYSIRDNSLTELLSKAKNLLPSVINIKYGQDTSLKNKFDVLYSEFQIASAGFNDATSYLKEIDSTLNIPKLAIKSLIVLINKIQSIYGESIVSDPVSSVIAALPKQYWSKYKPSINLSNNSGDINKNSLGEINRYVKSKPNRFNTTFAKTKFGNSDIAIKMVTPGEFIVKGVRVDADEAVRNSFKVVSQGIKYIAYANNIPVTDKTGSPKKSITPLLDSLAKKASDYEFSKDRFAKATDAFLAVLADASKDLNETTDRNGMTALQIRGFAINRIKTAYEIYKTILSDF